MKKSAQYIAVALGVLAIAGCGSTDKAKDSGHVENSEYPEQVYWGDTHVHTDNSIDAFGFGNRLNTEAAMRFAKGEPVTSTKGVEAQLSQPLDFIVIADHAAALGATKALYNAPRIALLGNEFLLRWYDMMHESEAGSLRVTAELIDGAAKGTLPDSFTDQESQAERVGELWAEHGNIIERYNEPGKFTAFMGFEYTPMPSGDNLHRVVMFRDNAEKATQVIPFSSQQSLDVEDLWAYMNAYEKKTGGQMLSIPHNSNVSNGQMFAMNKFDGSPIDAAYAKTRALREPIIEVTQIKGDSETHPFLSPNDEFASYGVAGWDKYNLSATKPMPESSYAGSYAREALKRGLLLESQTGTNPYKFGVIGSSDTHTSLADVREKNFIGKHTGNEPNVKERALMPQNLGTREGRFGWHYLSSGYAGVWATSNTREAIFDAMMRREVYATTGPRMQVRFFGGFDYSADDISNLVPNGYAKGVPMGGDIKARDGKARIGKAPTFLISALMDPESANLDRVQIVKGWIDSNGQTNEKIYNIVWGGDRKIGSDGKLPAVGNTVDLTKGTWRNDIGAAELLAFWQDPDFAADQNAFYYARVLEIPTPTWPVYDSIKYGFTLGDDVIKIQQERAYTSPIWYNAKG